MEYDLFFYHVLAKEREGSESMNGDAQVLGKVTSWLFI